MNWQVWGPPLLVLAVAIIVGMALALRARLVAAPSRLAREEDLLARKATLIEEIRALEGDRGKLEEAEFQARREELIGAAAAAIEDLDAVEQGSAPSDDARPSAPQRSRVSAVAYISGAVGFFVLLGFLLVQFSSPRTGGGSMTGGSAGGAMGGGSAAPPSPEEQALIAAIEAAKKTLETEPDNLAALNTLTYDALLSRNFEGAMSYLDRARVIAPTDPDVLVHLAVLQVAVGMHDKAEVALAQVIVSHPGSGKARLWHALVLLQTGQAEAAAAEADEAIKLGLRPDEASFARSLAAEARNPTPKAPASASGAPMAGGASGAGGSSGMAMAVSEGSTTRFSGKVSLAPGVSTDQAKVLFVTVYRNAQGSPPPVSSKRLSPTAAPTELRFTENDLLMGGAEWPAEVWVRARLDADGQPGSGPGDVDSPLVGPIHAGDSGVELILGGT